jgi:GNAT superfamily N-acetyltransferase
VARDDGRVIGWVALAPVSDRCDYAGVAEDSVYIAPEAQGRGVGRALLAAVVASAEQAGIWTVQPVAAQRGADCGSRDAYPKPEQLALDALVAPARILPGQPDDQVLELLVERRSPCSAVRVGPGAGDQPPMPAQQRLRLDEEA